MALNQINNNKVRSLSEVCVIDSGKPRQLSEIWVKTKSGLRLLWQAITSISCYGMGFWEYGKGFVYGEGWKYMNNLSK